jgi:fatty-acyl-CoA synthase
VRLMGRTADNTGSSSLDDWRRALDKTATIARNPSLTFPVLVDHLADEFESAYALISDGECLSYRALSLRSDKYSRWALAQGLVADDVVCLLMPNCPEYMAIWLGLTRVGVIVSLLNTNLFGESLKHSINIVMPRHLIVGASLADVLTNVLPNLSPGICCWVHGDCKRDFPRIDDQAESEPSEHLSVGDYRAPSLRDRALYIYTSGTTGLPKAAVVSHYRLMQWTHWFAGLIDTSPTDRLYNCLPMYHSIGGVVAPGAALIGGGSVVIKDRFSATKFWDDVVEWDCTLFQYIGELCRYLLLSPPHPRETDHRLRLCCGNGLRTDVWSRFQQRFQIPKILEFYAATEANFSLYNTEGKPGAIGRIPSFLAHRSPVALIRLDLETCDPLRDEKGFCLNCSVDEVGEALGRIAVEGSPSGTRFEGYTQGDASDRKILRNVFAVGDAWFRTGDLMRRDQSGYFYFVDRIGDTFRWKGENVSTTEVEEVIAASAGIGEVAVYGVTVPGTEGRAGMAAIVPAADFDLCDFREHLARHLPEYARPTFLRMRGTLERTGTFKPQKQQLAREGCDPAVIADALYVDDRVSGLFVNLDTAIYRRISSGSMKL